MHCKRMAGRQLLASTSGLCTRCACSGPSFSRCCIWIWGLPACGVGCDGWRPSVQCHTSLYSLLTFQ
jgi:hypothetical protein